jgi:hypothetical protein
MSGSFSLWMLMTCSLLRVIYLLCIQSSLVWTHDSQLGLLFISWFLKPLTIIYSVQSKE